MYDEYQSVCKSYTGIDLEIMRSYDAIMYTVKDYHREKSLKLPRRNSKIPLPEIVTEDSVRDQLTQQLCNHLCGDHTNCWKSACLIKQSEGLDPIVNLKDANSDSKKKLLEMLKHIFYFVDGQNIITDVTTSINENIHSKLQIWLSKNTDLWSTYQLRVNLFILHHNTGLTNTFDMLSKAANLELDEIDKRNIAVMFKKRENHAAKNKLSLSKKKDQQKVNVERARFNLSPANVEGGWILYGDFPKHKGVYLPLHLGQKSTEIHATDNEDDHSGEFAHVFKKLRA